MASKVVPLSKMPELKASNVSWPSPATATIDVGAPAAATIGGLRVRVSPVTVDGFTTRVAPAPAKVKVEVLEKSAAEKVGSPVAFQLSRADGGSGPAKVNVQIDYNSFRHAYGGAWAARLGLRQIPLCGLAKVSAAAAARGECVGQELLVDNDFKAGTLSAEVDLAAPLAAGPATPLSPKQQALRGIESDGAVTAAAGISLIAITGSGTAAGVGTFAKTDLKASYAWAAGANSGGFTYSYPMAAPPVPGDLAPKMGLSYSSQAVDGQTASENIQSGLIGEGWSLTGGGFIESTFRPCSQDQDHGAYWPNLTDTCIRLENYQLSWSGASGELVPTGTPNVWRVGNDNAAMVEYLNSGIGGLGAHWRVKTADGTQWYFGRQRLPGWTSGARETNSVLTQQVWSNHTGEPCLNTSSFAASRCLMPYRWNLDYVVDVHGNSMSYWYERFTNLHGSGGTGFNELTYDRDAVLSRIEYGTRAGNETTATAPAIVEFSNTDRCLSDCGNLANWVDTPWDLQCSAAPCQSTDYYGNLKPVTGPTYWTTKRLTKVTTKMRSGATYKSVDEWSFTHLFPGGTDVPVLWLASVSRKGFDSLGNFATTPAMTFHGRIDRNRADYDPGASMADPQKYRIDYVDTESGGRIEVSYLPANEPACTWWSGKAQAEWPNYNHNASRCFMQFVTNRSGSSAWSWWHKFVVDKVTERDMVGGSPPVETSYQYLMDGAGSPSGHPLVLWSYSSNPWGSIKKAMNTWRGYPTVVTTTGPATGTQTKIKQLFYRGLDRDTGLDPNQNFFRRATITDSLGTTVDDHVALAGQVREEIAYDGSTEIAKTIHHWSVWQTAGGGLPTWQTPPERVAYMAREASTKTLTKVVSTGAWRTAEKVNTWDTTWGTLSQVDDKGDTGITTDDLCTRNTTVRNAQQLVYRAGTGSGLTAGGIGTWIDNDWSVYDNIFSPGDFNGDGKPDVIARSTLNGNLYLFAGNGSGGFSGRTEMGWGWIDVDQVFSPGDFSGDGKPDVIYRRPSDNTLFMVRGNGTGGWVTGASEAIGWGWDGDIIFSPGDITGDGKVDVMYRRPSDNKMYYIRGNGAGSWIDGVSVAVDANLWNDRDIVFGKGDVTGDGKTDLYARVKATGELRLYPGNGNGTFGAATSLGTGWTFYSHLLSAGDINADAKADVIGRFGGTGRLINTVQRAETVGVNCATTPAYPADLVSDVRTFFDNNAFGLPPLRALSTRTETVRSHNGSTATGFAVTTADYDQWGRRVWARDQLNRLTTTAYTHDAAGLVSTVAVTNPGGHTVTTAMDPLRGLPTSITDPNSKITKASYDPLGRVNKVWKPGHPTSGTPDAEYLYTITNGAPSYRTTKMLGPDGNQITSFEIVDGFLRARQTQTPTQDGKRAITDTQYDGRALVAKLSSFYNNASAPTGTLVTFADTSVESQTRRTYDGAGRKIGEQLYKNDVFQWQTQTQYGGDRTGIIPPAGGTPTQDLFDARGRVYEKRQFSGAPFSGAFDKTTYTFDDANRVKSVTDPGNNAWTFKYDLLGRTIEAVDPDTGTTTSTYDDAGQTLSTTDGLGQVLWYEYDSLGRRTKVRDTTQTGTIMADWVYDTVAKGQLTSTSRYTGGQTYTQAVSSYSDDYQPLTTTVTVPGFGTGGATLTYTVTNTYKQNGALATEVLPAVGSLPGETLTHTYVPTTGQPDRLNTSDSQGTYLAGTNYHFDGLVNMRWLGAAGKQVRLNDAYDPATRRLTNALVSLENQTTPGNFIVKYESVYGYDLAGNTTSVAGKTDGVADQEECFRYDYLRRLTEGWTQTSGACTTPQRTGADPYWRKWTFDTVGNRLSEVDKDPSAGDTTWTYQVGAAGSVKPHQLKQVTSSGPKATPTRLFGYDLGGNTASRTSATGAAQTLTWDKEGHLASLTEAGVTTSYIYDTAGNRLISSNANKQTLFLPDGSQLEKIGTANPLGTRFYGGVAVRDATGLRWTISDQHGTSVAQIDPSTLAVSRRRSMPYGEARGPQGGTWKGNKGYVGGIKDDSSLTHLGAREYDPTLGRFLSRDPVIDITDPQQINGFAYSHNSPITNSDPTGKYDTCGVDDPNGDGSCPPAEPPPGEIPIPDDTTHPGGGGGSGGGGGGGSGGGGSGGGGCFGGDRQSGVCTPAAGSPASAKMLLVAQETPQESVVPKGFSVKKALFDIGVAVLSNFATGLCYFQAPGANLACGAIVGAVTGAITYALATLAFGFAEFNWFDFGVAVVAGLLGGMAGILGGLVKQAIIGQLKQLVPVIVAKLADKAVQAGFGMVAGALAAIGGYVGLALAQASDDD
ncbi:FG-GAP-like repeat-containing protein [Rhizocola hellebori]|uniref:FG-GAP-like repeat-containing protein n=1 Tax=Rhizocola hellebori TaxID=1392758 RepID=UPI001943A645|nr:FG-GAP-like repeat-containing protein [Rhizocola hellebori]